MEASQKPPVPLRIVPPPDITGVPWSVAEGTRTKKGLLGPLNPREQILVCAIAEALGALQDRAEKTLSDFPERRLEAGFYLFRPEEKESILGLLVAFKDATGCAWVDADWV